MRVEDETIREPVAERPGPAGTVETPNDGRRLRGLERRGQILAAAVRCVARDGVGALTHRAAAAEAGVSLASVTYHFPGIDDLLTATFDLCLDHMRGTQLQALQEIQAGGDRVEVCVALVLSQIGEDRDYTQALYEMVHWAGHRPGQSAAVERWRTALAGVILQGGASPDHAAVVAFAIRGLVADSLLAAEPPTRERLLPVMRRILSL